MVDSSLSTKLKVSYGIADIGASLAYVTINIFLLKYLVDVVGLRPDLAGWAFLVGRAIDAITDPLMGTISDRFQSRWGRRMPFIWAGIIPIGFSFAVLWMLPILESQLQLFALTCLLLSFHAVAYTIVQVPYLALTPELAPEYSQRTVLSSFRAGFGTLASMIASVGPLLVVAAFAAQNELRGWVVMGVVFGVIISLSYLIMALGVQSSEAFKRIKTKPVEPESHLAWWQQYGSVFSVYGFRSIFMLFMAVTIGLGIVSAILPFYLEHGFGLIGTEQTLAMAIIFGMGIVSLMLWTFLSGRLGKRVAFAIGIILFSISLPMLVYLSPYGGLSPQLISFSTLAGMGLGAILLFPWAMLPDVADFDEVKSGRQREGLLYAFFTFGQKLAAAIGVFITGQILNVVGYMNGEATQTALAVSGIRLLTGVVAPVLFLIALYFLWCYPITKEAHATLERN